MTAHHARGLALSQPDKAAYQVKVDDGARRPKPADPVQVFQALCWSRAHRYATGELDLPDAVDWLQAQATKLGLIAKIGQDEVQRLMAEAFAPVRTAEETGADRGQFLAQKPSADPRYLLAAEKDNADPGYLLTDDPEGFDNIKGLDDYAGLSSTFAAACRKADAKIGARAELEDIPPGTASAARLQREYERSLERAHTHQVPKSVQEVAEWFAQTDPIRLETWLLSRPATERAAIVGGLKQKQERS
jgi:hypothetical protein